MSCPLVLQAEISTPENGGVSGGVPCKFGDVIRMLVFTFDPSPMDFGSVRSGSCQEINFPGTDWVQLPQAADLTTVQLLAFSPSNGTPFTPFELLLGAKPVNQGVGGVFPTGFAGGEAFAFDVDDNGTITSVSVTFTASAQSATQVANEINAAAVALGLPPIAAADATPELVLTGPKPGADQALAVTTANAQIGFSATGTVRGTGSPQTVSGNLIMETSIPGSDVWVRGGPTEVNVLVAGVQ